MGALLKRDGTKISLAVLVVFSVLFPCLFHANPRALYTYHPLDLWNDVGWTTGARSIGGSEESFSSSAFSSSTLVMGLEHASQLPPVLSHNNKTDLLLLGIWLLGEGDRFIWKAWLDRHGPLFERLVVIDGSEDPPIYQAMFSLPSWQKSNLVILPQSELEFPGNTITDQTLRAPAMIAFGGEGGGPVNRWILLCHADEFWTLDPRQIVQYAERQDPKVNVVKVQVLTASPMESHYKETVKKLAEKKETPRSNMMALFSKTFDAADNILGKHQINPIQECPWTFSRKGNFIHGYQELRFFRWQKDMSWGKRHGIVIPEHMPQGRHIFYESPSSKSSSSSSSSSSSWATFYVHFKLHDFSDHALYSSGKFVHSKLKTKLPPPKEAWGGTFLDVSDPLGLQEYPPQRLESVVQEWCRTVNNRTQQHLSCTVDFSTGGKF